MRSKRRRPRRRSRARRRRVGLPGVLLFILVAALAPVGVYVAVRPFLLRPAGESAAARAGREAAAAGSRRSPRPREPPSERPIPPESPPPEVPPGPLPSPLPGKPARVSVVIDDLGRSLSEVGALERLGIPLTYAVLPFESKTGKVVAALHRRGEEVLLHLPMEGRNGANPGPGALTAAMGSAELERRTEDALAAVPGATGVNNHMGSLLSADPNAMRAVLGVIAARGLFFLDSRTTAASVGYRVAIDLGMPAAERQVFLDPDQHPEAIAGQFRRLLLLARQRGSAIAIGHPHSSTLEVLSREVPEARRLGYEFVPVSYLVNRSDVFPE